MKLSKYDLKTNVSGLGLTVSRKILWFLYHTGSKTHIFRSKLLNLMQIFQEEKKKRIKNKKIVVFLYTLTECV